MKKSNIIPKKIWSTLFDCNMDKAAPANSTPIQSQSCKTSLTLCQIVDTVSMLVKVANGAFAYDDEEREYFAVACGDCGEEGYYFDAVGIDEAEQMAREHFAGGNWYNMHIYGNTDTIIRSVTL